MSLRRNMPNKGDRMKPQKENPLNDESLAAESIQGADGAEALPRRIERYGKARERASQMAEFCQAEGHAKEFKQLQAAETISISGTTTRSTRYGFIPRNSAASIFSALSVPFAEIPRCSPPTSNDTRQYVPLMPV